MEDQWTVRLLSHLDEVAAFFKLVNKLVTTFGCHGPVDVHALQRGNERVAERKVLHEMRGRETWLDIWLTEYNDLIQVAHMVGDENRRAFDSSLFAVSLDLHIFLDPVLA